jgi:small-conductance mechanosensitive channel
MLFGLPLEPGLLSRAIVLAGMLVGVLVTGITIVMASTTIGWLAGSALGAIVHKKNVPEDAVTAAGRR